MTDRTPSPHTLTRLVLPQDSADAFIAEHRGADQRASFAFEPYAAIDLPGGLFVVCNEGVGWTVTNDAPFQLDIYSTAADGGSFSMAPVARTTLTPAEVREAMTGEPIALHDLIRRFGARLEANYALWSGILDRAAGQAAAG